MKTLKSSKIEDIKDDKLQQDTQRPLRFAKFFKGNNELLEEKQENNDESLFTKLKNNCKKAIITLFAVSALYTTNINCGENATQPPAPTEDAVVTKDISSQDDIKDTDIRDVQDATKEIGIDVADEDGKDIKEDIEDITDTAGFDVKEDVEEDGDSDVGVDDGGLADAGVDSGIDATTDINGEEVGVDTHNQDVGIDVQDVSDVSDDVGAADVCTPGNWETKTENKMERYTFNSKSGTATTEMTATLNIQYETNGCEIKNEHVTNISYEFSPPLKLSKVSLSQVQLGLCTTTYNCDWVELEYPGETQALKLAQTFGFGPESNILFGLARIVNESPKFTGCHPLAPPCYTMKEINGSTQREVQVCCFGNGQQPLDIYYNKVRYTVSTTTGATCLNTDDRCIELLTYIPNSDISKVSYSFSVHVDRPYMMVAGKTICYGDSMQVPQGNVTKECILFEKDGMTFNVKSIEKDANSDITKIVIEVNKKE